MSITSDEVNFLIYRYLQESGFAHSAYVFGQESLIGKSTLAKTGIPPGALIHFLQRGLQYAEIEKEVENSHDWNQASFSETQNNNTINVNNLHQTNKTSQNSLKEPVSTYVNKEKDKDKDKSLSKVKGTKQRDDNASVSSEKKQKKNKPNHGEHSLKHLSNNRPKKSAKISENDNVQNAHKKEKVSGQKSATVIKRQASSFSNTSETGYLIQQPKITLLKGHTAEVFSCEWNPVQLDLLASGAGDGSVKLWRVSEDSQYYSSNTLPVVGNTKNDVTSLSWHHTGEYLATGEVDGSVRFFSSTGSHIGSFCAHKGTIFGLKFSPCGEYLLSIGSDHLSIVWDLRKAFKSLTEVDLVTELIDIVDTVLQGVEKSLGSVDISCSDKMWRADGSNSEQFIYKKFMVHDGAVIDAQWRNSHEFATGSSDSMISICDIRVKSRSTVEPLRKPDVSILRGHVNEVNVLRWSPCGRYLASGSDDITAKIWEVEKEIVLHNLKHNKEVYCMDWSKDGSFLVTGSFDNCVRIWDPEKGTLLFNNKYQQNQIFAVVISGDSNYVFSASFDKTVVVAELKTGKLKAKCQFVGKVFELSLEDPAGPESKRYRVAACTGGEAHEVGVFEYKP